MARPGRPMKYEQDGVEFRWNRGNGYIEIFFAGSTTPLDVINVYDYAKGEVTIDSRERFVRKCEQYMEEQSEHDRQEYNNLANFYRGEV